MPLKARHGALLYSAQTTQGTAVTPATAAGIVGYEVTSDADLRRIDTIGQAGALFFKPGVSRVDFDVPIEAVQTAAILQRAIRVSGEVPWTTFGFGYVEDSGTKYAWQVQDCKVNRLELRLEAGGLLTGSVSGTGGLITDLTTLSPAQLTPTPFMSYEAVLTKDAAAWEAQSFQLTVDNQIEVQSMIPGTAPSSFKRGWSYQTEGPLEVSGEITRFVKSGVDLQADTLADFTLALTMTDIAGGGSPNSIAVSITGARFGSERLRIAPGGDWLATTPFVAEGISIA